MSLLSRSKRPKLNALVKEIDTANHRYNDMSALAWRHGRDLTSVDPAALHLYSVAVANESQELVICAVLIAERIELLLTYKQVTGLVRRQFEERRDDLRGQAHFWGVYEQAALARQLPLPDPMTLVAFQGTRLG